LQFTLVDCPGHASLIRTIIGGAQIIDIMILVIDVTKGKSLRYLATTSELQLFLCHYSSPGWFKFIASDDLSWDLYFYVYLSL